MADLTFDFTINPASGSVRLHDGNGHTKVWDNAGNTLFTEDINVNDIANYYRSVSVTLNKVYLTSDNNKTALSGSTIAPYAGTYNFKINVGEEGRLSSTEPTTVELLNAMSTTALDLVVTITYAGDAGATSAAAITTGDTFYASVIGDDNTHSTVQSHENATFSVGLSQG